MKSVKKLELALLFLAFSINTTARASEVEWTGQVRVRAEISERSLRSNGSAEWDVFQRSRLGARFTASPEVTGYFQVQDSRIFGFETNTLANENNVDVHQAWGQYTTQSDATTLRLRFGRQELSFGDERVIGSVGWSNTGRSFDALQVKVQHGAWAGHWVAARLIDGSASSPRTANDDLFLTYHTYDLASGDMKAEGYLMYRDDDAGRFETTMGQRLSGTANTLKFAEEFVFQSGSSLSAFMLATSIMWHTHAVANLVVGGGFDWLSGDDPATRDRERFDLRRIFQTGHKFHGLIDMAPALAGAAGLLDPYVKVIASNERWKGSLAGHFFWVEQEAQFQVFQDPVESLTQDETDSYLGTELDAVLGVEVAAGFRVDLGGSVLIPGAVLEHQGLEEVAKWAYLQTAVGF